MRFAGLQSPAGDRFGPFRGGGRTAAEDVPAAARLRRAWRAALLRHEAGRVAEQRGALDAMADMRPRATVAAGMMAGVEALERGGR